LSEEIKGNVVCSALSVQLALAMLHTGAKGETAKKLKKPLCLMSTDLEATNRHQSGMQIARHQFARI
jgi:serine protease inhibitor